jgi:hypothetical protein
MIILCDQFIALNVKVVDLFVKVVDLFVKVVNSLEPF